MKANYTPQRKVTVISLLREARKSAEWWELSHGAKLQYTLSAIICNDIGAFTKTDLTEASSDARTVSYARRLMREAGV